MRVMETLLGALIVLLIAQYAKDAIARKGYPLGQHTFIICAVLGLAFGLAWDARCGIAASIVVLTIVLLQPRIKG